MKLNSFLNPSIKNFLPNPNNLIDMEKSTLRTFKAIKKKKKLEFLVIMMLMELLQQLY